MNRIGKSKALDLVKKGAMLVDMRSPVAFRDGHVAGAVNLPLRNFINAILKLDRKQALIMYSEAINDVDLKQGLVYTATLGFKNIYVSTFADMTETKKVNHAR